MTRAGTVELTANLPDGRTVSGSLYRTVYGPDAVLSLWRPRVVWELTPTIGDTGPAGMDALLAALHQWLQQNADAREAADDSAVEVLWPSADVNLSPAFHRHGLRPATVLAVRPHGHHSPTRNAPATVRTATATDIPELLQVVAEEQRYSAAVLAARRRDNTTDLLTASLRSGIVGGRVFVAHTDGVAVGAAVCGVLHPEQAPALTNRLPDGLWGYIGQFAVLPASRGSGVGGALAAEAHRVLDQDAPAGTFLFYEPANPLSSVFWPRRAYRPTWTRWTRSPAAG